MGITNRTVERLARNYRMDVDDALILLWYCGSRFKYLKTRQSQIRRKDFLLAKEVLTENQTCDDPLDAVETAPKKIIESYDFGKIGSKIETPRFLSTQDVIIIHDELTRNLLESEDPISPGGIKNLELLESAVAKQQTSFSGKIKYPTIESAGAALMYGISNNHPFHNGNKRTALVSLLVFLNQYKLTLNCKDDDLFKISLEVARREVSGSFSRDADSQVFALASWIVAHIKGIKKGERPVTIRQLIAILRTFDCEYNNENGRFERAGTTGGFFGRKKSMVLSYKIPIQQIRAGDIIDKGVLKSLRKELQLNEEFGFDQDAFYLGAEYSASEFINTYRNLLKRLARR